MPCLLLFSEAWWAMCLAPTADSSKLRYMASGRQTVYALATEPMHDVALKAHQAIAEIDVEFCWEIKCRENIVLKENNVLCAVVVVFFFFWIKNQKKSKNFLKKSSNIAECAYARTPVVLPPASSTVNLSATNESRNSITTTGSAIGPTTGVVAGSNTVNNVEEARLTTNLASSATPTNTDDTSLVGIIIGRYSISLSLYNHQT